MTLKTLYIARTGNHRQRLSFRLLSDDGEDQDNGVRRLRHCLSENRNNSKIDVHALSMQFECLIPIYAIKTIV